MGAADEMRAATDEAWRRFREALDRFGLEATTSAGWPAKEMVGHVAFWLETVPPFVTGAFRGDPSAYEVTFPSGYRPEDDWPGPDVHNAREAAWARSQPADLVLARAEDAFAATRAFLETVDDDELATQADYFRDIARHLDEHRVEELEA